MAKKIVKKTIKTTTKKLTKKINKKTPDKSKKQTSKSTKSISKKIIYQKVKKTMLITEITRAYPECALIMMNHGLYCVGCGVAMYETLEEGATAHGMSDLEIDSMVKEMNSTIEKK